MTDWNFHSTFWIYTVSYRKNTVPSAMNIQYTWLRKIDNFLLYIIYIYYLSIHYFKKKWFNVLKLKTHNESNIRFKTIFNIFAFVSKNGAKIVSFIKKKNRYIFMFLFWGNDINQLQEIHSSYLILWLRKLK